MSLLQQQELQGAPEQFPLKYLGVIWRRRATKAAQIPSYNGLILALKLQAEKIDTYDLPVAERDKEICQGIEDIFSQTSLRRFEFLFMVSDAVDRGYLDKALFDLHPFKKELSDFRKYWGEVLMKEHDPRLYDSGILHVKE